MILKDKKSVSRCHVLMEEKLDKIGERLGHTPKNPSASLLRKQAFQNPQHEMLLNYLN